MFGCLLAKFRRHPKSFARHDRHGGLDAWSGGVGLYLNPARSSVGCLLILGQGGSLVAAGFLRHS